MTHPTDLVPASFAERVAGYPPDTGEPGASYAVSGADWLRQLPRLLADLLARWSLVPDGPARSGVCAVALPVTSPARTSGQAVLKVTWPHVEAVTEHLALRRWDGNGSVRLLRADPARFALLLERLDSDTDLDTLPDDQACEIIGDLLATLSVPAIARVPTLSAYAARQLEKPPPTHALPRRFVDQARRLAGELGSEVDVDARLLHTDLHYQNVLRQNALRQNVFRQSVIGADRHAWLAIDPKPMAGDPAFEVAPALWNRVEELGTGSTFRWNVRRRLEIICERAGIDEDRAKAWTIVRMVDNAEQEAPGSARASLAVALVKAMND
ncbi:MAG: aminoglycoside phosphotransferase family protein [Actinomycetota bacterium]|nr:aminoglycoside phosphotransferase family protein [Actinomycetota bacterium]